jgi:uncharacterized protein
VKRLSGLGFVFASLFTLSSYALANEMAGQRSSNRANYDAYEFKIPMRDGVKLYTVVWVPKALTGTSGIILERTPYGAGNLSSMSRTTKPLADANFIFAYQDVRGKGGSEGGYVNIRPLKKGTETIDETTDTWDTAEFLSKNVPKTNGNIGLWGISYPGFYAGIGGVNTHPAIKAISPQAPVSDWFVGDDVHHNGALFLQETFDFGAGFDVPRGGERPKIDRAGKSAYKFYLDTGALPNFDTQHYKGLIPYWKELMEHDTYDEYWKERSLPRYFKNVKCAVLTVGGMFDKEDMWGAQNLYKFGERQNKTPNFIVMGPWLHGGWSGGTGSSLGEVPFGTNTSEYYREKVELPFFQKYLNNANIPAPAEATVFETGTNEWKTFPSWPPKGLGSTSIFLQSKGFLSDVTETKSTETSYLNDPKDPTPYLADFETSKRAPGDWLIYDQRYFSTRKDVLTYSTYALSEDIKAAGPITVDFWIKSTGTDCDLVVKVIDVFPSTETAVSAKDKEKSLKDFQMMVRSEIMRVKFRESLSKPIPMVPGQPTRVKFDLNDVLHTFKKGHKLMIHVQSNWFPIADRNPNKFCNINTATDADFQPATITVMEGGKYASKLIVRTLKK